ncbi:MAG: hypothetical protein AB1512_03895 [Thermodesulfobacteriota bacterium]
MLPEIHPGRLMSLICFSIDNHKSTIINHTHISRDFKTILTPGWQEAIERYEPAQISRSSKSSPTPRRRAPYSGLPDTRYGKFTIEADSPKPPGKERFKKGDRVKTSHGTGTVVETDGEKYLVALDGQVAQLWEKEWGIRKT